MEGRNGKSERRYSEKKEREKDWNQSCVRKKVRRALSLFLLVRAGLHKQTKRKSRPSIPLLLLLLLLLMTTWPTTNGLKGNYVRAVCDLRRQMASQPASQPV